LKKFQDHALKARFEGSQRWNLWTAWSIRRRTSGAPRLSVRASSAPFKTLCLIQTFHVWLPSLRSLPRRS